MFNRFTGMEESCHRILKRTNAFAIFLLQNHNGGPPSLLGVLQSERQRPCGWLGEEEDEEDLLTPRFRHLAALLSLAVSRLQPITGQGVELPTSNGVERHACSPNEIGGNTEQREK